MVRRRTSHVFLQGMDGKTVKDLVIRAGQSNIKYNSRKQQHFLCSFRVEEYGVLLNVSVVAQDEIGALKSFHKIMKKRGMKFHEYT